MNIGSKINVGVKPNKNVSAAALNTYFMFIFVKKKGGGGALSILLLPPPTVYDE